MRLNIIEIPFGLLLFAFTFSDPIITHFMVYRTCYVTLGYNQTECAALGSGHHDNATTKLEEIVQPYVTVLAMTKRLIETCITALLCFFIGPWSDKYGRRPVLLATLTGYTIAYVIITIVVAIPSSSPWLLITSTIPICLFGGFPSFLTATICYITDSTSVVNRGWRMGIFEAVITIVGLSGNTLSSFVFNAYGYLIVFVITTGFIILSWLLTIFIIGESLPNPETEDKISNLFKFSLVSDTIKTTVRRRDGYDRALLFLIIGLTVIFLLAVTADGEIIYLYFRRKLHWSLRKYTLYKSGRKMSWVFGSIVGGYFLHKLLGVEETVLMLIGFLCTCTTVFIQGIATKDWHMYVAGATVCFGGSISPMSRSLVSKLVSSEESGKVFSFIIITETFVNLLGSPLYTYIYNKTISTLPGAFNFVTTGIYAFEVLLTIPAIIMQIYRQEISYEVLDDTLLGSA